MTEIFTFEKIYRAYLNCRKRKKNTVNALRFEIDREKNMISLLRELKSKRYKISRHVYFIIKDPACREIFAADFRDRVVHHLLYNEIEELFEKDFIENSFANRKGKGTHKALGKLKQYLKEAEKNSFFLKLDVRSFFCSINKDILFEIISNRINNCNKSNCWKKEVLWLVKKIIYHNPTRSYIYKGKKENKKLIPKEKSLFFSKGKGLPIGNLTSQLFANIYLNCLDYFIIKKLKIKRYIRYVDDLLILGKRLAEFIGPINYFLRNGLDLEIKKSKTVLQPVNKGIDFLGYFVKPDYILVRRKIVKRFKNRMYKINIGKEVLSFKKILAIKNSYFSHFKHAFSFNLREKDCCLLKN